MPVGANFIIGQRTLDSKEKLENEKFRVMQHSPDSILPKRKKKRFKSRVRARINYFEQDPAAPVTKSRSPKKRQVKRIPVDPLNEPSSIIDLDMKKMLDGWTAESNPDIEESKKQKRDSQQSNQNATRLNNNSSIGKPASQLSHNQPPKWNKDAQRRLSERNSTHMISPKLEKNSTEGKDSRPAGAMKTSRVQLKKSEISLIEKSKKSVDKNMLNHPSELELQ